MCIIFRISNPHDTYHEGYFLLILRLPPNDEHDGDAESKQQRQKSKAPRFQPGDRVDSARGQNTQAQNEKRCKGETSQNKIRARPSLRLLRSNSLS